MTYGAAIFPQHARLLADSAISPEVARTRGYVSVDTKKRLENLRFERYQRSVPGLLTPAHRADGSIWGYRYRPDDPRVTKAGSVIKYKTPKDQRNGIDIPPGARDQIGDSSVPLLVTEGSRKADATVSAGLACVSLNVVYGWRVRNGRGGRPAVADSVVPLLGAEVGMADGDLAAVPGVSVADLVPILRVLYHLRRIDRCWEYVVLSPSAAEGRRAA
jgi:hypothetical protein